MRVTEAAGGHVFELRLDEGLPAVRFPLAMSGSQWQDVTQQSALALFAASSPSATFLRMSGLSPLQQHLPVNLGVPSGSADDAAV